MLRKMVLATVAVGVVALAGAAAASPLTRGQPSLQGGMVNRNVFETGTPRLSREQREIREQMRDLRSAVRAAMARNCGQLPEAERTTFQQRLDLLNQAYRQAS